MTNDKMKVITTYYTRGREFYIIRGKKATVCGVEKEIWGIETNHFDEEGRLTREVNGIEGHLAENVAECIHNIETDVEMAEILRECEKSGKPIMEALKEHFLMQRAANQ